MGQLMTKEVLYEPLKELAEGVSPPSLPSSALIYQYPVFTYLTHPLPSPLKTEAGTKKKEECVKQFLAVSDKPGYSDANEESNKAIVDLTRGALPLFLSEVGEVLMMRKRNGEMQSYGLPPA